MKLIGSQKIKGLGIIISFSLSLILEAGIILGDNEIDITQKSFKTGLIKFGEEESEGGKSEYRGSVFIVSSPKKSDTFYNLSTEEAELFRASVTIEILGGDIDRPTAGIYFSPSSSALWSDGTIFFGKDNAKLIVDRLHGGTWTPLLNGVITINPGVPDTFEIVRENNRFRFFYNGREVALWTDPFPIKGWVRIWSRMGTKASFQNWQVYKIEKGAGKGFREDKKGVVEDMPQRKPPEKEIKRQTPGRIPMDLGDL